MFNASMTTVVCGVRYMDMQMVGTPSANSSAIRDSVVANRLRPLNRDARAVRQYGLERLHRQSGGRQYVERPGDQPNIVEPTRQGDFGEVPRFS
jgi:hypothetical protein